MFLSEAVCALPPASVGLLLKFPVSVILFFRKRSETQNFYCSFKRALQLPTRFPDLSGLKSWDCSWGSMLGTGSLWAGQPQGLG